MTSQRKIFDSSLTRVRPAFHALVSLDPTGRSWFGPLLGLSSRAAHLRLDPADVGSLVSPPDLEYQAAPPAAYLRWLLNHATELDAKRLLSPKLSKHTLERRSLLLSGDSLALTEALRLLGDKPPMRSWYVLEGPTNVDCALFGDRSTVFIEGKRTERGPSKRTIAAFARNQIARNLECLAAATRRAPNWYVLAIVAANSPAEEEACQLDADPMRLSSSLRHVDTRSIEELISHYLGYTTWERVQQRFGLPEYPHTRNDVAAKS